MNSNTQHITPHILLLSGWQTVNIGDVAHTAGILSLIERTIPGATVTLWPYKPLTGEFTKLILDRFPNVHIIPPISDIKDPIANSDILSALDKCDFCLHNSGPATLAWAQCEFFSKRTDLTPRIIPNPMLLNPHSSVLCAA